MEKSPEKKPLDEPQPNSPKKSSNNKTGVVFDQRMMLHKGPKSHPECPQRIESIEAELRKQGLIEKCVLIPCRNATHEEVLSVHAKEVNKISFTLLLLSRSSHSLFKYFKHIEEVSKLVPKLQEQERDFLYIGMDTYFCRDSENAAYLSAGGLVDLTEKVVNGDLKNGFAIIRPPGITFTFCFYLFVYFFGLFSFFFSIFFEKDTTLNATKSWDSVFSTTLVSGSKKKMICSSF
jgi:hypothetical protein